MSERPGLLTRVRDAARLLLRADYLKEVGPFDARTDAAWSVVRSQEPAAYRRAGETVRRQGFEANAIVYACARVIADQVGTAHLEAYRLEAQATVVLDPDGPLQALLDQPAPQLSGFKFRQTLALHMAIYGNAYAYIARRPNGEVDRIRIIHPERMQQIIVDEESDEILAYVWNTTAGTQVISPWTDMIHVKDHLVDPDLWFGFPRGLAALYQMITDTEASKYVRQILNNSGVPALVFFARQNTSLEDLKRAESAWNERMAARGERGSTRFLSAVEQMHVVGHTLKDLEFPSLRQISREDICAAFGVDPRLIGAASAKGNEGGLSGSQYQEARRRLEQQTCHPMRVAIQDALDGVLTPEYGEVYARFSPDAISAIVETPTELAERVAILVREKIFTLDEARRAVGQPEAMRPEHLVAAESLRTVSDALEVGEAAVEAAEAAAEMADAADDAQEDEETQGESSEGSDEDSDEDNGDAERAAPAPDTRAVTTSRVRIGPNAVPFTPQQLDAAWRRFDEEAQRLEVEVAAVAADAIRDTAVYVLHALAAASDTDLRAAAWWDRMFAAVSDLFSSEGPIRRMWRRRVAPLLARISERSFERLARELGGAQALDDAMLQRMIQERGMAMSAFVTDTLAKDLLGVLRAARGAGLTPQETADALRAAITGDESLTARAKRVARTEVIGALNDGEYAAAMRGVRDGSVRVKSWLSQRDQRVRASHVRCDGQGWIDAEQAFSNGLRYPHDPMGSSDEVTNCRCTLIYADRPLTEDDE